MTRLRCKVLAEARLLRFSRALNGVAAAAGAAAACTPGFQGELWVKGIQAAAAAPAALRWFHVANAQLLHSMLCAAFVGGRCCCFESLCVRVEFRHLAGCLTQQPGVECDPCLVHVCVCVHARRAWYLLQELACVQLACVADACARHSRHLLRNSTSGVARRRCGWQHYVSVLGCCACGSRYAAGLLALHQTAKTTLSLAWAGCHLQLMRPYFVTPGRGH